MSDMEILLSIIYERQRQNRLHPHNNLNDYLAILVEEVGEIAQSLQGDGDLKEEIIQLAAVCIRWLQSL